MLDRRRFLLGSLVTAGATSAGGLACSPSSSSEPRPASPGIGSSPRPAPQPPRPRSILVLGGTGFLGPHVVDAARARGHKLTLFNRGKTNPGLFPDLETLHGDRDGHLEALVGRTWDAVVDTSGFVPRLVRASAELLAPSVGQYVFISTISVYGNEPTAGMDETAPTEALTDPTTEDIPAHYGALKAACERAAEAALPGRTTNIRPGLIVGPLDPSGRFTHWVTRLADGGEVAGPGDGATPIQYIDARDLAAWIIRCIEDRTVGVFNALGPDQPVPMREVLETCRQAAGASATITWIAADFLEKQQVHPWADMPMWLPPTGDYAGFSTRSNRRAVAAGLRFRPLLDTARDTLAWVRALPADAPAKMRSSGLSRDREAKLLAAWKARR